MARPTEEVKTSVIKVRLTDEQLESIKAENRGNLSKSIRELIELGLQRRSVDRIPYNPTSEDISEINSMAFVCDMTTTEVLKNVRMLLTDGSIKFAKGTMYVDACPFNYDGFMEKCREKGVDPQDAMDKLVRIM